PPGVGTAREEVQRGNRVSPLTKRRRPPGQAVGGSPSSSAEPGRRSAYRRKRPPGVWGLFGRLATRGGRLPSKLHLHCLEVLAAVDAESHRVARLLRGHEVAEPVDGVDRVAVDGDDDVSAEDVALAGEGHLR